MTRSYLVVTLVLLLVAFVGWVLVDAAVNADWGTLL